jgi:hypothetical protein
MHRKEYFGALPSAPICTALVAAFFAGFKSVEGPDLGSSAFCTGYSD